MIDGLTNSEGIPALERLMQFTGQRHRVILDNIANLSTPGFRPRDVSPEAFQEQLADAIDAKRGGASRNGDSMFLQGPSLFDDGSSEGGGSGPAGGIAALGLKQPMIRSANDALPMRGSREFEALPDRLILHPKPVGENILFHDGRDANVERVMQSLVENFMAFRASAQLLRSRLNVISMAIRERI